jgi:diguanylate cyclase (GGDEF)-like protein
MLNDEADKDGSDREYSLRHGSAPADAERPGGTQARPDFQKLVRMFSEGFRGIYVARAENPQFFGDLGIADAQVETFVAVPILSEKKMVGILTMDNLSKDDVERLAILVMQFALEIKKVRLYEAVERMAITDSLTGLYVRRHFRERMDDEVRRSKKHKFSFAFIMLDIDGFKRCNDMYGHLVGDVVLRDVTRIMRENVREIDILGRYGGEELAVILPETNAQSAMIVGERLRSKIAGHVFQAYDEKLTITVSAGISVYPRDASDSGPLIEKADAALYAAKKSGKNVVCEYKKEYNNIS